jgi:hypothetical protein
MNDFAHHKMREYRPDEEDFSRTLMQKLRFTIVGECLYAANTGTPFSRQGVVSICNQHLSAKGARADDIDIYEGSDEALIACIRDRRIAIYRGNSNELLEHRNAEDETTRDYSGRCLLELLQNADDAMAPPGADRTELIGAKGLGFKSVLELTDRPEIHSGPFHFGFDATRSRALLAGVRLAELVSIFRIPHEAEPDALTARLAGEGYTTIVRLPLRDDTARELAEAGLAALTPHFLLLAQHLEFVDIRTPRLRRAMSRSGQRGCAEGALASLRSKGGANRPEVSAWRVWRETWPPGHDEAKQLSVAIAIPEDKGVPMRAPEPPPLHVFYPTDDELGLPFLVHASLDVQHNRKHIRAGDNDPVVLDRLAGLVSRIATQIPAESTLTIFRDFIGDAPAKRPRNLLQLLRYRIRQAVLDAEFVPVLAAAPRRVRPSLARIGLPGLAKLLRRGRADVAAKSICAPGLDDRARDLERFGASPLRVDDYVDLLRYAHCRTVEDCIAAARIVASACLAVDWAWPGALDRLRRAPIWRTATGEMRGLAGERPLLMAKPKDWPDWCATDVLDPELAAAIFPDGAVGRPWPVLVDGWLHHRRVAYLRHCIAPILEGWSLADWRARGWDALKLIESWAAVDDWEKQSPFVPGVADDVRAALAAVACVPSGRNWVPARACYASNAIGGANGLVRAFRNIEGRHACSRPLEARQWFAADRWRALLRYLGVSWEPKIQCFGMAAGTELAEPIDPAFDRAIYVHSLRYREKDWYLEHFPAGVASGAVAPAALMAMVASLAGAMEDRRGRYLKKRGVANSYDLRPWRTFVHYQLQSAAFLPVRPGIDGSRALRAGPATHWPRTGLRGITPELDLAGLSDARRAQLKPVLVKTLAVQTGLPEAPARWLDWSRELADAVAAGRVVKERTARDFYEAFLERKFLTPPGSLPARVVCLSAEAPGLRAVPRAEACWIDRPTLAMPDVLTALVRGGLAIIPPLLNRGAAAPARLGVKPASQVVNIVPRYARTAEAETLKMTRRLEARWRAIAAQCQAKGVRQPAMPKVRAVVGLVLEIGVGEATAAEVLASAHRQDEEWLISLDGDEWEGLALTLAEGLNHAADMRYRFAAVLRPRFASDARRALMEDGIPPYQLESIVLGDEGEAEPEADDRDVPPEVADTPALPNPPAPPPAPVPAPPPPIPSPTQPPAAEPGTQAPVRLTERPLYDPEPSGEGRPGGGGWGGWGAAGALGRDGEAWLAQRMRETMPAGMTLVTTVRDENYRESDIVLSLGGRSWHVEVKTLASQRIYWSALEIEKAQIQRGAYWMCFLTRDGSGFRVHWSWDPLNDLLPCERRMEWQWAYATPGPLLERNGWNPIEGGRRPQRPPDRSTAAIRIEERHLEAMERDGPGLPALWQRIAG